MAAMLDDPLPFVAPPLRDPRKLLALNAALSQARTAGGWDGVRMHDVAAASGLSLAELTHLYPDRDSLADGLFDFADEAMIGTGSQYAWSSVDPTERIHRAMFGWFDALAPHRAIVRGMLGYKMQPEHLHLQAQGVKRISRTVQTLREVALLQATGWRRELEEAVITSAYLSTMASWLWDESPAQERSRRLLRRLLKTAGGAARRLGIYA